MSKGTRRDFLKMSAGCAAAATLGEAIPAVFASPQIPSPSGSVEVRVTDATRRHLPAASLRWQSAPAAESANIIVVDPSKKFQPVLGFGAAFTDAACYTFSQLPEPARQQLFEELFSPKQMGISVCRLCIGSSDYSRNVYSYDDGAPDPELSRFSIEHDRGYILPALQRARKINPELFLLGSPWSPPNWMKDNNSMLGGTIHRPYLKPYANYIVKFLQAYKAEGVEVNAVTPQNEVDTDQDSRMPACLFPQEVEVQYVGEHLGPAIQNAGLNTQIWLIDHNYNLWGRAICELDDPKVSKYTKSIAWHGYVGQPEWMQKVLAAHPDVEMYWTEGGPDVTDPNYTRDWSKWSQTFAGILRHGARCAIGWNLALDENGKPNIGPFSCGGVVTINSQSRQITRSGQYWALYHYSHAMRRNATVVASHGETQNVSHVAVVNPDGSYAVVLTNSGNAPQAVQVRLVSAATSISLPADSITTLMWR